MWPSFHKVTLSLFLILVSVPNYASQPYTPEIRSPMIESWRWRHCPELEGKGVRCIVENPYGGIWFGANKGIVHYDGYRWEWHNEQNGLSGFPVEKLYASESGAIYAVTSTGIFLLQKGNWRELVSFPADLELSFYQIRELSGGQILICTNLGVLEMSERQILRFYTSPEHKIELSDNWNISEWVLFPNEVLEEGTFSNVSDILEIEPNLLWISVTQKGHSRILEVEYSQIQNGTIKWYEVFSQSSGQKFGETQKLLKAQDNTTWIVNSSTQVGIHKFARGQWTYLELGDLFGGDEYMTDIVQSLEGTIWIGGIGKLFTYKDGKWAKYMAPEFKIPANHLILTQSRNNAMWIGGDKSKVYSLDFSFSHWMTYENLNFQCDANRNEQWFLDVTGRAIKRIGNSWISYDTDDGFIDAPVRIFVTTQGQIWAAGSHQGVAATAFLKDDRWWKQLHPDLSWGIDYRAAFESKEGDLWFGGGVDFIREKGQLGGVLQLQDPMGKNSRWIHHRYHENGLLQSNAYGIGQSMDGRIWIGGGSLYYFDGKSWNRPDNSHFRQFVNVVKSRDDILMVGSRYYGVFLYDGADWIQYNTESGLSNNTVISVYRGSDKKIWVATENDISCFDGICWANHIFPEEMNMNVEGGEILQSLDGAIWINHSSRDWKRRAFIMSKSAMVNKSNYVAYRYFRGNNPPETFIKVFNEEVAYRSNNLITWQGEDFFGETPDERLVYSYRINQGEWSPWSHEKQLRLHNLENRRYRIEVRTRDLDYNVDPTPATLEFVVLPPVWKQHWFVVLVLAFLLTFGIFEYRIITKKQKLERLNTKLNTINEELKIKNEMVLRQQDQIMKQNNQLETSYLNLEKQNQKIQYQHDKLEKMVYHIEELSKSKIKFFTNISHELRTPLTLILGPMEQMLNNKAELSNEKRRYLLELVNRNSLRLLKLINQLLEIRRIENNALELNLVKSNLQQFTSEIILLFDQLALDNDIKLSFKTDCEGVLTLFDPDKIEKILANLLTNAFKNTPRGGYISVLLIRDYHNGKMVFNLSVEDTGKGISQERMKQMFKRYFCDPTRQWNSGIGLSYIKDLVDLHKGSIFAESKEGVGTKFTVRIPEMPNGKQKDESRIFLSSNLISTQREIEHFKILNKRIKTSNAENAGRKGKQRILIVEDNHDMAEFLKEILLNKYYIGVANHGLEGLMLTKNQEFDLIISDVMMPEMGGLEFCQKIKSDLITSHIPVILLTAKSVDKDIIDGYTIGADDYITKTFNTDLLIVRVENLLNRRRQLQAKFNHDFTLQSKDVKLTSPDDTLLKQIVEIMEEHISDPCFNVNKMCGLVHLSHMHFIRKVKKLTGKKPIDLLKSYRLKRAKDLLIQQKANISEVAYMVGYDLPNSFSRAFKREFGLSPSEFIDKISKSVISELY